MSDLLTGIVGSRICPCCGHHELGLATKDGNFFPLRPGMGIQIITPPQGFHSSEAEKVRQVPSPEEVVEYTPWVPDPAQSHPALRLKYGVKVGVDRTGKEMTPEIYRAAYLDKLRGLIEKEIYIPIPVLLDRYFAAPHLATGNASQIAEALWRELREIREPARRVEEWLQTRAPSALSEEMECQVTKEAQGGGYPGEEAVLKELDELSLEDFLEML